MCLRKNIDTFKNTLLNSIEGILHKIWYYNNLIKIKIFSNPFSFLLSKEIKGLKVFLIYSNRLILSFFTFLALKKCLCLTYHPSPQEKN